MKRDDAPLVSVLITTYNQEEYIAQTLDGVLMQQVDFVYEVVIGEDCSTDATRAICRSYAERYPDRIVLIENNPNKGLLHNYFDTLLQCRGKYIADCAGDDYWIDPLKLQQQVELMEGDDTLSLVHSNWCEYWQQQGVMVSDARGKKGIFTHTIDQGEWSIMALLNQRYAPLVFLSSSLYRRTPILDFYHQHSWLFRSRRFYCEDLQLVFAALQVGRLYCMEQETTVYRIDEASVSNTRVEGKRCRFELSMLELRLAIVEQFGLSHEEMNPYYQQQFAAMFWFALRTGKRTPLFRGHTLMQRYHIALSGRNAIAYRLLSKRWIFQLALPLFTLLRTIKLRLKR